MLKTEMRRISYMVTSGGVRRAPGREACEQRFVSILGDAFVASSALSICGFLITCSTLGKGGSAAGYNNHQVDPPCVAKHTRFVLSTLFP